MKLNTARASEDRQILKDPSLGFSNILKYNYLVANRRRVLLFQFRTYDSNADIPILESGNFRAASHHTIRVTPQWKQNSGW